MKMCRQCLIIATCVLMTIASNVGHSRTITIDFDTDAQGNPIATPDLFVNSFPLRTEYSSLGVTFAGENPNDGGSIVDDSTYFNFPAHSGDKFLAFDAYAMNALGGATRGPLTVSFSTPVTSVTILARATHEVFPEAVGSFSMEAFRDGAMVDVDRGSHDPYTFAPLTVLTLEGIDTVVLSEVSGDVTGYQFDDLAFTPIPEPTTFMLGSLAVMGTLTLSRGRTIARVRFTIDRQALDSKEWTCVGLRAFHL